LAKKTGLYYLPPLITFLIAVGIIIYSLGISDIGKMNYGLLGIGFLIAAVGSAILLPAKLRTSEKRAWTKGDIIGLFVFPFLIVVSISAFTYIEVDDWMVKEKGTPIISHIHESS